MYDRDVCPLCGGYSFNGAPCEPQCDLGRLHKRGIDLEPIEANRDKALGHCSDSYAGARFRFMRSYAVAARF